MSVPTDFLPPELGLGECEGLRSGRMRCRYVNTASGALVCWEFSNSPNADYFACVVPSLDQLVIHDDDLARFSDILALKCWVLEKMEEYNAETPRTSIGVS